MKKNLFVAFSLIAMIHLTSCGISNPMSYNLNNHNTEVNLSRNNFKVIKTVTATDKATYFFGFGGTVKKALYANCRARIVQDAGLEGSAKALVNETVETHFSNMVFITTITITVSAQVVEFTN